MKTDISAQKLAEDANDQDISAALDKLFSFRDEIAQNIPETAEGFEPGAMLSIRV